ncbi:MAG: NAD(+)/NADH kinase [Myxococcota bacterium]
MAELPAAAHAAPDAPVTPMGILANPLSGRDVRRLAARAGGTGPQEKRNQVARVAVGAAAGGARRVLVLREPFRVSEGALEHLSIDLEVEAIDIGAQLTAADSERAVAAMREAGCRVIVVLGGDGTHRCVAATWSDAPIVALSTGTNNVFPQLIEPTLAGAAAGLVASGRIELGEVAERAKVVRVEIDGEDGDLALVDAALLVDDFVGNRLPFDPAGVRSAVLARAEPAAVGVSSLGGLLEPCFQGDDAGVEVRLSLDPSRGQPLLAPISPGLYRTFHVEGCRRLALGESVTVEGPGVLAFDGDRERKLASRQRARLRVERTGPRVIDVGRTLERAARDGLFLDRGRWRDAFDQFVRERF